MRLRQTLGAIALVALLGLTLALPIVRSRDETNPSPTSTGEGEDVQPSPTTVATESPTAPLPLALPTLPPGDFPTTAVAATEDGRLVLLDTATGDVFRTFANYSDLREPPPEGGHFFPIQIAVTSDRTTAYIETCCEPAGGNIERLAIGKSSPPKPFTNAYSPSISPDGKGIAFGIYSIGLGVVRDGKRELLKRKGDRGRRFFIATSWVGNGAVAYVTNYGGRPTSRSSIWLHDVTESSLDADRLLAHAGERVENLATRRDGHLVWVGAEGTAHVLNPATGKEKTTFELGPVGDIAYDRSGTWLLVSTKDRVLRWYGAGRSGTIPGRYVAAGW